MSSCMYRGRDGAGIFGRPHLAEVVYPHIWTAHEPLIGKEAAEGWRGLGRNKGRAGYILRVQVPTKR